MAIARRKGETFVEKLFSYAEESQVDESLKKMTEVLKSNEERIGRLPWHRLIQEIWEALSGPERMAERYGIAAVRNGREFLKLLYEAEKGVPEETLRRLEFFLAKAYAPPDPLSLRAKVALMTVHHAKGLEFDTVMVPHLDRKPVDGFDEDLPYILERLPGGEEYLIALKPDRRRRGDQGVYALLKGLQKARCLGEAKRLYYVALTRAKKALYLSGVCEEKEGAEKAPKYSLLYYLMGHPGTAKELQIDYDPEGQEDISLPAKGKEEEEPQPLAIDAEPLPYRLTLPSGLHEGETPAIDEAHLLGNVQEDMENLPAMARGTVIHRIFQDLARGRPLPSEKAVTSSLLLEGVEEETAKAMAPGILDEVGRCLEDPFMRELLRFDHPFSACEYALEDFSDAYTVRSGVLDRLVFDGQEWLLVDYKTASLPDGMEEAVFLKDQEQRYRPQLLAYREMLAKTVSVEPERIRLFLYFTGIPKAYELVG